MRYLAAAIAGALAFGPAATAQAQAIEWSIQRDGSNSDGSRVQLTLETRRSPGSHSVWSQDYATSELSGLTPAIVTGPARPVRFALVRDAGRLDCNGQVGALVGSGACSFTIDPSFVSYLQARGLGRPT